MDPHRGFHHRLNKRQGLGRVLGSLDPFNGGSTFSTATPVTTTPLPSQNTGNLLDPGGISSSLTSLVGSLPTPFSSSSGPFSVPSSTPLTPPSGSTSSTSTSFSSAQTPPSSTTSSTTSSTDSSSTPTPAPTPDPSSTGSVITYTSSDGTQVIYITSTLPVPSATTNPPESFLQNHSLEGGVFALVGIVVLIIIFMLVTWFVRKRHHQRLERDLAAAVTFDPGATDQYERQEDSVDKHQLNASGSSSGHGHGWGYGSYAAQPAYAPQPEYATQLDYHGAVSYPAAVVYRTPSPTSLPYLPSSSAPQQPNGQGGANLTRKFSDRKPVPPLVYPTYDPAVPPQFY